jgi:uncharacterized phage protein (TIGR02216 family)
VSAPAAIEPFPWRAVMAFGLGRLRWPPEAFWAATPLEILAASEAFLPQQGVETPSRSALAALMQAHPDLPNESLPTLKPRKGCNHG